MLLTFLVFKCFDKAMITHVVDINSAIKEKLNTKKEKLTSAVQEIENSIFKIERKKSTLDRRTSVSRILDLEGTIVYKEGKTQKPVNESTML